MLSWHLFIFWSELLTAPLCWTRHAVPQSPSKKKERKKKKKERKMKKKKKSFVFVCFGCRSRSWLCSIQDVARIMTTHQRHKYMCTDFVTFYTVLAPESYETLVAKLRAKWLAEDPLSGWVTQQEYSRGVFAWRFECSQLGIFTH